MSPSQVDAKRGCRRKWAYRYIDKIKTPQKPTQAFGTEGHDRVELWLGKGQHPGDDDVGLVVQQGIKPGYLPTPSPDLMLEHYIEIPIFGGAAMMIGYMDCGVRPVPGVGGDPNEPPIVHDWKFTKDLRWAMKVDELRVDAQPVIYGRWALDAFEVDEVFARWVYFCGRVNAKSEDGRPRTPRGVKKVEHLFSRAEILEQWEGVLDDAHEIVQMHKHFKTAAEVPPDETHCDAYGGCDHREYCPLSRDVGLGAALEQYDRTHNLLTRRINDAIDAPNKTENPMSEGPTLMEALQARKTNGGAAPPMFAGAAPAAPEAAPAPAPAPAAAGEVPAMFAGAAPAAPAAAPPAAQAAPPAPAPAPAAGGVPPMFAGAAAAAGGVPPMFAGAAPAAQAAPPAPAPAPAATPPAAQVAAPAPAPAPAAAPPATVSAVPAMFQAAAAAAGGVPPMFAGAAPAAPAAAPAPAPAPDVAAEQVAKGAKGVNPPGNFPAVDPSEAGPEGQSSQASAENTAAELAAEGGEVPAMFTQSGRTPADVPNVSNPPRGEPAKKPRKPKAAAEPEVPSSPHFIVAYNALPARIGNGFGQVVHLGDLLAPLLEHIAANHRCNEHPNGVPHWNLIEYGNGKGILAHEFAAYLDRVGFTGVLLVDGSTPEGIAVKDVLMRRADLVFQGVR